MYTILELSMETDFSNWGQRLYTAHEIDRIIIDSGLIVRKPMPNQIYNKDSLLVAAAKTLQQNELTISEDQTVSESTMEFESSQNLDKIEQDSDDGEAYDFSNVPRIG